jgi:PhnB protein
VTRFTPFLLFEGNCAEAMAFYQRCFGGELTVTLVGETPMAADVAGDKHGLVINARLEGPLFTMTATDWLHETRTPTAGNLVALYISEAPLADLARYFDALAQGADPQFLDPLRAMPFGTYGHLIDRFSVSWFFQGEPAVS